LRLRTIAPIDMTKEERRQDSQTRHRERMHDKRMRAGVPTRQQYLAKNHLSRTRPWEAAGMSKATWYRKGKPMPDLAVRQVCSNKAFSGEHRPVSTGMGSECQSRSGGRATTTTVGGAEPELLVLRKHQDSKETNTPCGVTACIYGPMSERAWEAKAKPNVAAEANLLWRPKPEPMSE
jgi:hypothetical protein